MLKQAFVKPFSDIHAAILTVLKTKIHITVKFPENTTFIKLPAVRQTICSCFSAVEMLNNRKFIL